jgi:hypothetical protein
MIVGGVFDVFEVGKITGVGQGIGVDDAVLRVFIDEEPDEV